VNTLEPVTEVPAVLLENLEPALDLKRAAATGGVTSNTVTTLRCSDIASNLSCSSSASTVRSPRPIVLLSSNSYVEFSTFTPKGTTPFSLTLTSTSTYTSSLRFSA
jgi:hypothetical protein